MGACRCPAPRARSPRRRPQKAPVPSSGRGRELGSGPGPGLGIESGSVANGPRLGSALAPHSGFETFHLPARTTRRITAVSRGSIGGRAHRWATGRARNVAAARSWEARALTPEASSASHSSPRCVHERLDPKKPAHALGGCARLAPAVCAAPLPRHAAHDHRQRVASHAAGPGTAAPNLVLPPSLSRRACSCSPWWLHASGRSFWTSSAARGCIFSAGIRLSAPALNLGLSLLDACSAVRRRVWGDLRGLRPSLT